MKIHRKRKITKHIKEKDKSKDTIYHIQEKR